MEIKSDKNYVVLPYGHVIVPMEKFAEFLEHIEFVDQDYNNGKWQYAIKDRHIYSHDIKLVSGEQVIAGTIANKMEK